MRRGWSIIDQKGFSLVEVILSSAVFALFVTALLGSYLYGQEATMLSGNRASANMLAEEGLEAVRNIRDAGYANLTNGTYGLTISGNQWNLSGSQDMNGVFTRQIIISSVDTERKSVTANVTWQQNPQRTGTVSLATRLTDWQKQSSTLNTCNNYAIPQGYSTSTCRQNSQQCGKYGETYLSGGNAECVTGFPGDPSHDTCCALP